MTKKLKKPTKQKGRLIVIDGSDGSGKATQTRLLVAALQARGQKVQTMDFPRYDDNFFGGFLGECLHGEYGDFLGIHPKIASVLYAADRWESHKKITQWIVRGYTVVLDRYVSANQIHQGGKIADARERAKFLTWLSQLEYETFGIPRPDQVIYLDVPSAVSRALLEADGKKLDHVEQNLQYAENSRKSALWLARRESGWSKVTCARRGKLRSIEDIHEEIINLV